MLKNLSKSISYRRILLANDVARSGFIKVYQIAFAGPPYFEVYTDDDVEQGVWIPHVPHCIVVAKHDGHIVGFGCAHPILSGTSPNVQDFLEPHSGELPFDPSQTIYMSELAVLDSHRRSGIGLELINQRFSWARENGFRTYLMRTAAEGSNSANIYLRLGAKRLPFLQDVQNEVTVSLSIHRQYLWGTL